MRILFALASIFFVSQQFILCHAQKFTVSSLQFLGKKVITHNSSFGGTTIGGLSGIDYDSANGVFYLISDDRSSINPARFYTAKIQITPAGIDSIQFLEVHSLLQANGQPYPSSKTNPSLTPDPESIRYNSRTGQLFWTSEGERIITKDKKILVDPSINIMNKDGRLLNNFECPPSLRMKAEEKGPHQNGTLEGITFDNDYKQLYASMEETLYEDGPRADVEPSQSWSRIFRFDVKTRKNNAQYAYPLDPVAHAPVSQGSFKINGISEILFLQTNQLLIVERSFTTGRLASTVKLFSANLSEATDIKNIKSLKKNPPTNPIKKKLLLNMDELGIFIDNIEGVTFGPDLPNGHHTLIFVADNNFIPIEESQFLLFEIIP